MAKGYDLTVVKHGEVYNIHVYCERKKRKTLALRVYPKTAKVLFSMPFGTPEDYASKFFERHKPWLQKQLEKILPLRAAHSYEDGDVFYLFGKQVKLSVTQGTRDAVVLDGDMLVCRQKQPDKQKLKLLLEKFFNRQFDIFLQANFANIFAKYNEVLQIGEMPVWKTRKMTNKWGICRPLRREITLSKRLVHMQSDLIEYVIAHELCHFVHLNHSGAFWQLLQSLMPDCRVRRDRLNSVQTQVDL